MEFNLKTQIDGILGSPMNQPTLVKFNSPVMVGNNEKAGMSSGGSNKTEKLVNMELCQDSSTTKKEAEEIFNRIIPPREWIVDGNIWRQTVSSTPATRGDVIALEEQLTARLKQYNAQLTGICEIRRELYAQCFDEIIRQVTINCTERGLLLLRVRDETNITLNAYRAMYESAAAFGMRKTLRSLSAKSALEQKNIEMGVEKDGIELTVLELETKLHDLETKFKEQEEDEQKKHAEEAHIARQLNEALKIQLEESILPARPPKTPVDTVAAGLKLSTF